MNNKKYFVPKEEPKEDLLDRELMNQYFKGYPPEKEGVPPPNVQKQRNYDVDVKEMKLGTPIIPPNDDIKYIMNPNLAKQNFPQTKIIPQQQNFYQNFNKYQLGQTRNQGQYNPNFVDKPSGKPTFNQGITSKECIFPPDSTYKAVLPDKDLGKPVGRNNTNQVRNQQDEQRQFGVPTFRTDINKPEYKSLGNRKNYEQITVGDILKPYPLQKQEPPPPSKEQAQQYLAEKKGKNEIRATFKEIGMVFDDNEFDKLWKKALQIENSQNSIALASFMQALKEQQK